MQIDVEKARKIALFLTSKGCTTVQLVLEWCDIWPDGGMKIEIFKSITPHIVIPSITY